MPLVFFLLELERSFDSSDFQHIIAQIIVFSKNIILYIWLAYIFETFSN